MPQPLMTLADAKLHLKIEDSDHDAEIQQKLDQASGIVADYLTTRYDPSWNWVNAPGPVKAAALLVLGDLWVNRGDTPTDPELWKSLRSLLARYRDPAYA